MRVKITEFVIFMQKNIVMNGMDIGLVVFYGCDTWSLTLREGRKLKVFENMVLRRIFGPRRDEVTG